MVSTPNAPEGLFERIEKEPESICLYHRVFLDYTYGLGRIYIQEEIQAAKASPSFERECNLKYLGLNGNVFHTLMQLMQRIGFDDDSFLLHSAVVQSHSAHLTSKFLAEVYPE
jgi:hypothetical protein